MLCVLSLCMLLSLMAVRGAATVLHANAWQLLELLVVTVPGLLSLARNAWCVRCGTCKVDTVIHLDTGTPATVRRFFWLGGR